eukprot:scaffold63463_cov41-Attheya_sp.AAC.2
MRLVLSGLRAPTALIFLSATVVSAFGPAENQALSSHPRSSSFGVGIIANTQSGGGEEFGTHKVLQEGLSALGYSMQNLRAIKGDGVSGDGPGIMTQIPWKLFKDYKSESCPQPGVGQIFLPRDQERRDAIKEVIENVCKANELEFIGWREVPIDTAVLGPLARDAAPSIWQFFVKSPERLNNDDDARDGFERTLYLVRRRFDVERKKLGLVWDDDDGEVYVASFSS